MNAQSEFKTHSGLHAGLFIALEPVHRLHTANLSPKVSHAEFRSHGLGVHGCNVELSGTIIMAENYKILKIWLYIMITKWISNYYFNGNISRRKCINVSVIRSRLTCDKLKNESAFSVNCLNTVWYVIYRNSNTRIIAE